MPVRFAALVCLVSCWLHVSDTLAADQFPYTAQVLADDAYVRSGPGRNFYPTDKMKAGDTVEVYRHDPGGWSAIRPPEGSFSWVTARYVTPLGDDLGEVMADQVVARVGSQLSNVRDVIQVRLNKGERVVILKEYDDGTQTWYKIAAPAGEFRWISASLIRGTAAADDSPGDLSSTSQTDVQEIMLGEVTPRIIIQEEEEELLGIDAAAPRVADYETPVDDQSESFIIPTDATEALPTADKPDADPRFRPVRPQTAADKAPIPDTNIDFDGEIAEIELQISQLVAEEPTLWVFDELTRRVASLEDAAGTAVERGQARSLQVKLDRMAEIHDRYKQFGAAIDAPGEKLRDTAIQGANPSQTIPPSSVAGVNSTDPLGAADVSATAVDRKFDAEGVLRPVVSRRTDAPRYALVDESGMVLSFLTPSPGMNLQPQLGARLGVVGTRGYLPELRKPHVMVKRIVVLEAAAANQP